MAAITAAARSWWWRTPSSHRGRGTRTQLAQHTFRIGDELLVAHLAVATGSQACSVAPPAEHAAAPPHRRVLDRRRAPIHAPVGHRDVTPVADDVDEPSFGEQPGEAAQVQDVHRGLVGVARFTALRGGQGVQPADRVGERRGARLADRGAGLGPGDRPSAKRRIGNDQVGALGGVEGTWPAVLPGVVRTLRSG